MNYFEKIRISLISERINKETIKNSMGDIPSKVYLILRPYVESLGEKDKKDWEELNELLK